MLRIFFKDAYEWYSSRLLRAYGSKEVKPRKKRNKFSQLKKKAPKVPEQTCPIIDEVLSEVSTDPNMSLSRYRKIKSRMEKLRKQNEQLRASGIYWYEIAKAVFLGKN